MTPLEKLAVEFCHKSLRRKGDDRNVQPASSLNPSIPKNH
jgi:hypothetical protein